MVLDKLLRYRETQSAAPSLSAAHKRLKNGVLNCRGDAGAVIPDADLQTGSISGRGYDDLPRVRRNRLASIENEVGDHPFQTVGIEPAHGQAFMMMLDGDARELLPHTRHPDRVLDCVDDDSGGRPKSVTTLGALQQGGDHLVHPVDGPTDFLVRIASLHLANIGPGEKFRICEDGGQRMAKIVGNEGDDPAYGGKRL